MTLERPGLFLHSHVLCQETQLCPASRSQSQLLQGVPRGFHRCVLFLIAYPRACCCYFYPGEEGSSAVKLLPYFFFDWERVAVAPTVWCRPCFSSMFFLCCLCSQWVFLFVPMAGFFFFFFSFSTFCVETPPFFFAEECTVACCAYVGWTEIEDVGGRIIKGRLKHRLVFWAFNLR